jgi:hypothetical protein
MQSGRPVAFSIQEERMRSIALGLTVAGCMLPAGLSAQACLGVNTSDGRTAIHGDVGFAESTTAYGVGVTADLRGPLSVLGSYALVKLDDVDTSANQFGGGVAYELANPMCRFAPWWVFHTRGTTKRRAGCRRPCR